MSPEGIAALSAVVVAVIGAGPSYIALRRARGAVQTEGEATRDAVGEAVAELRGELRGMRDDVRELREWTTAHTAEHILINTPEDQ